MNNSKIQRLCLFMSQFVHFTCVHIFIRFLILILYFSLGFSHKILAFVQLFELKFCFIL